MVLRTDNISTTNYFYNAENRLVKVIILPNNQIVTYQYSANGERISKTSSPTDYFNFNCHYCPVCCNYYCDISEGYDDSGNVKSVFTQGQQHDEHLSVMMNDSSFYYLSDGLGSVRALIDEQANVVQSYEYDPFGVITYEYSKMENAYRFTGREYEDEFSQYYYRARYYDPASGRFTSRDPKPLEDMTDCQGRRDNLPRICGSSCEMAPPVHDIAVAEAEMNQYSYVDNNPVNWVDPSGKEEVEGCSPIGAVVRKTVCRPGEGDLPLFNCHTKNTATKKFVHEESIEVNLGAEYQGISVGATTGYKEGEEEEIELQPCTAARYCYEILCLCAYDRGKSVLRTLEDAVDRMTHGNPLNMLYWHHIYVYSWQCSATGGGGFTEAPLPCDKPECKCCPKCQEKK
jgi:RHS repeat-associated protein